MGSRDLDVKRVAVGVLHLLEGRAVVDFPGSTRSSPSRFAVVSLSFGGAIQPQWRLSFPFSVPWDLWQDQVVPVLRVLLADGIPEGDLSRKLAYVELLLRDGVGSLEEDIGDDPPGEAE